jgi:hypothetical protein
MNQTEMKISFVVFPAMVFVPDHVLHDAIELVRMLFLSSYYLINTLFKFYTSNFVLKIII